MSTESGDIKRPDPENFVEQFLKETGLGSELSHYYGQLYENGQRKLPISETPEKLATYMENKLYGTLDTVTMIATFRLAYAFDTALRVLPHLGYTMEEITPLVTEQLEKS